MTDYLSEPHAYRRNLPHIQPINATYFVTYRLADSIPKSRLFELQIEKEDFKRQLKTLQDPLEKEKQISEFHKLFFKKYDDTLDKIRSGPVWLQDPEIALIVSNSIKHYDGTVYGLLAYTIMPNHVHQVFHLSEDHIKEIKKSKDRYKNKSYPVTGILESIKKYTARRANEILDRRGGFWERESYDHVVRNNKSLVRIVKYVLNNPVKAGLVELPEEWEWNYCKEDFRLNM